jgi:EpsI family protein
MKKYLGYIAMLLFLLATACARFWVQANDREQVPPRTSLSQFPAQFNSWKQISAQAMSGGTLRELKADDYLSGLYASDRGAVAYLFIAYYGSQRHRQTIHSPQNCMPSGGWTMSHYRRHTLGQGGNLNEYMIEKDDEKMLAFYWYQGRGRMDASEYWSRAATIKDAMWLGRTDGALVRVIVPIGKGGNQNEAEDVARAAGLEFSQKLLPLLPDFIPN